MKTTKLTSFLIVLMLTLAAPFAMADGPAIHNPYTILGVQLRSALIADSADGSSPVTVGAAVFQEIVPCRLISTVEADHYSPQWGMPAFSPNESRSYRATGELIDGNWTNPCSAQIPNNALAVAARVWRVGAWSDGTVMWVTPGSGSAPDKMSKVVLREGEATAAEATFLLRNQMFTITSQVGGSDLMVDVIGYFLPDPWGRGEKGDKGDTGAAGPQGPAGAQGLQGEKGERGADGAQGLKGDKGNDGAQGPQGLKGDTGAIGPQGIQGEKGERGADGAQGPQGLQGLKGDTGVQGIQGEKGERGADGAQGPQGLKGDKGDKGDRGEDGAIGPKGDKGDKGDKGERGTDGAPGLKGDKGDPGQNGAIGPMGLMGPQGPEGPAGPPGPPGGPYVSGVNCMAQGVNSITIANSAVHVNSAILVTVTGRSLGNTISVLEQSEGSLTVSGKPATCFRYVIFN